MIQSAFLSAGSSCRRRPGSRRIGAAWGLAVAIMPMLAGVASAAPAAGPDRSLQYPLRLAIPAGSEIWLCDYGRVLTGSVSATWDGAALLLDGRRVCPALEPERDARETPELSTFVAWCAGEHERVQGGELSQADWLDQVRERMQSGSYDGLFAFDKGIEVGDGSMVVYLRVADGVARPYVILLDRDRYLRPSAGIAARHEADAFVRDVLDFLGREPDAPHLIVVRGCGIAVEAMGMRAEMMISQLAEAKRGGGSNTRGLVPEDILSAMARGARP